MLDAMVCRPNDVKFQRINTINLNKLKENTYNSQSMAHCICQIAIAMIQNYNLIMLKPANNQFYNYKKNQVNQRYQFKFDINDINKYFDMSFGDFRLIQQFYSQQ